MSKLKNLILSTVLIASATFIQSCSDDENIEYITEIGTVSYISNNESEQTQVNGDYNGLSNIINKNALKYAQSDSVGQRILYTYIIEADNKSAALPQNAKQSIKIYDIYKVLTKKWTHTILILRLTTSATTISALTGCISVQHILTYSSPFDVAALLLRIE